MQRIGIILVALSLASCVSAAPLILTGTCPANDNAGSCVAPVIVPGPAIDNARRIVLAWSGPVVGTDSVYVQPGARFTFTKYLPSGTYTLNVHAANAGGWICDTTLVRTITNPPQAVVVN